SGLIECIRPGLDPAFTFYFTKNSSWSAFPVQEIEIDDPIGTFRRRYLHSDFANRITIGIRNRPLKIHALPRYRPLLSRVNAHQTVVFITYRDKEPDQHY